MTAAADIEPMRRYTSKRSFGTLAELNITPLLDLAFVLLIIFMITTPLIENRMDLIVPSSTTASAQVEPDTVLTVEVARSGSMSLEGEMLTADSMEARLAERLLEDPRLAVIVRPDRELPVQQFIDVMDILKRVGIAKVGVMTVKPEENSGKR